MNDVVGGESRHTEIAHAWQARAGELAAWSAERLLNRSDVWGAYLGIKKRKPGRKSIVVKGRLDDQVIERHYRGMEPGHVIGTFASAKDKTSRWLIIEISRQRGNADVSPQNTLGAALAWHARLEGFGLFPLLESSDGQGGFRLWVILDEPLTTGQVGGFGQALVADFKAHGLQAAPRIAPSEEDSHHTHGQWVRLPGRHSTRDHWSRFRRGEHWVDGDAGVSMLLEQPSSPVEALLAATVGMAQGESPEDAQSSGWDNNRNGFDDGSGMVPTLGLEPAPGGATRGRMDRELERVIAGEAVAAQAVDAKPVPVHYSDAIEFAEDAEGCESQAFPAVVAVTDESAIEIDTVDPAECSPAPEPAHLNAEAAPLEPKHDDESEDSRTESDSGLSAYIESLPKRLREGQGRNTVSYQAAAFLIHDLGLPEDEVLSWLGAWNAEHDPPLAEEDLKRIVENAERFGRRTLGDQHAEFAVTRRDSTDRPTSDNPPGCAAGVVAESQDIIQKLSRPGRCIPIDSAFRALGERGMSPESEPGETAKRAADAGSLADLLHGGLHTGEVLAIGGKTGAGKSTFVRQLADAVAADNAARQDAGETIVPVLYVSLDLDADELATMSLSRMSGVAIDRLHRGAMLDEEEREKLDAAGERYRATIEPWVGMIDVHRLADDALTVGRIARALRELKASHQTDRALLVIDPVDRVQPAGSVFTGHSSEASHHGMYALQTLAKRENTAVIAVLESPVGGERPADPTVAPEPETQGMSAVPGAATTLCLRSSDQFDDEGSDTGSEAGTGYAIAQCVARRWQRQFSPVFRFHRAEKRFEQVPDQSG